MITSFILITYLIDKECYLTNFFSSLLRENRRRDINESLIADNDMDLRFTFSLKCCLCTGKFKTFSAIQKHAERKHTVEGDRAVNVVFLDNKENEASMLDIGFLNRRSQDFKIGYLWWLAGLTEQINASLNPRLRGKWRI